MPDGGEDSAETERAEPQPIYKKRSQGGECREDRDGQADKQQKREFFHCLNISVCLATVTDSLA
jgi:hypothetical protein